MNQPTALIADDMEEMRLLLRKTLETLGINVIAQVADGEQALQAIAAQQPDLCFLDIDMPGRSGLELLREIGSRRIVTYPVIISGHSTIDNVKAAVAEGAKAFVVKPYTFDKVKQVTDRYFSTVHRLKGA